MRYSVLRNRNGFTLIELLIVISILSVVALAIYSTLNNGVKIWYRVNTVMPEEDLAVFFDKFGRDITNIMRYNSIRFFGEAERIEFASCVEFQGKGGESVGKTVYAYKPEREILYKWKLDFSDVYNGNEKAPEEALRGIASLRFRYYSYSEEKKEYLWADDWVKEALPLAVRIELEFDAGGNQTIKTVRTFSIPVSG